MMWFPAEGEMPSLLIFPKYLTRLILLPFKLKCYRGSEGPLCACVCVCGVWGTDGEDTLQRDFAKRFARSHSTFKMRKSE